MNLNDVLKADSQYFRAILVRDLDTVRQTKVAVTDFAACKFPNSLFGPFPGLTDADQLRALGIERDLVAVHVEEKAGHETKNARGPATFKAWSCSSSPCHPLSRMMGARPAGR